ncbi:MAG: ATP-binding protein, partial [Nitrospirota bacterium]
MRRKYRKNNHIEINELVQKALTARKESKHFDFKSSCALDESGTWCEIVKDIVAMANSGGGIIVVGLDNNGTPTGIDVSAILALDPAKIADQIYKYTGIHFTAVDIISKVKA